MRESLLAPATAAPLPAIPEAAVDEGELDGEDGLLTELQLGDLGGGGAPLDAGLQESYGDQLGADLSTVRVHEGAGPEQAAADLGARAFTVGNDIHVGAGGGDPEVLAHEVVHTVQNAGAPGVARKALVDTAGDGAEREADSVAAHLVAGTAAGLQLREAPTAVVHRTPTTQSAAPAHKPPVAKALLPQVKLVLRQIQDEAQLSAGGGVLSPALIPHLAYLADLLAQLPAAARPALAKDVDAMSATLALIDETIHDSSWVGVEAAVRQLVGLPLEYAGKSAKLALPKADPERDKDGLAATIALARDQSIETTAVLTATPTAATEGLRQVGEHVSHGIELLRGLDADKTPEELDAIAAMIKSLRPQATDMMNALRQVIAASGSEPLSRTAAELGQLLGVNTEVENAWLDATRLAEERAQRKGPEDPAEKSFDAVESLEANDDNHAVSASGAVTQGVSLVRDALDGVLSQASTGLISWMGTAGLEDAKEEDKDEHPILGILADLAFDAITGGIGEYVKTMLVGAFAHDSPLHEAFGEVISELIGGVANTARAKLQGEANQKRQDNAAAVAFFQQQGEALNTKSAKQKVTLDGRVGPAALKSKDPFSRVQELRRLYITIESTAAGAADAQFNSTLAKWMSYLAQRDLHSKKGAGGESITDLSVVGSVDSGFVKAGDSVFGPDLRAEGLLSVEVDYMPSSVTLQSIHGTVSGLNEQFRERLSQQRLGNIKIPIRYTAMGDGLIDITVDEDKNVKVDADDVGKRALTNIAAHNKLTGDPVQAAAEDFVRSEGESPIHYPISK